MTIKTFVTFFAMLHGLLNKVITDNLFKYDLFRSKTGIAVIYTEKNPHEHPANGVFFFVMLKIIRKCAHDCSQRRYLYKTIGKRAYGHLLQTLSQQRCILCYWL